MDERTREVILAMNPWIESPDGWKGFCRERIPSGYVPRLLEAGREKQWREPDQAHLIVGPRQAGKTTLIWKYLSAGDGRVLFLNMEDPRVRRWCESPALFVRDVREELGPLRAIFIDEVQNLPEAALFIKGIIDLRAGWPVIVTGSSSYHLRSRTRESLAGRATRTTLLPFSLREALNPPRGAGRAARAALTARLLDKHVRFGGYPRVWSGDPPAAVLDGLVESFLLRDASDFFRVRRPEAMRRLLALMAGQTGNLVNLSEWGSLCGVSRDTVLDYAQIMEDAHLVELLPVYAAGKRAELTASRKVFFVDNGVRNALLRDFREPAARIDAGALMENWVFTELRKRIDGKQGLFYWRTRSGAEVDFVVETGKGLLAIEVKAAALAAPRLTRSARSFIDAYHPKELQVVNARLDHRETVAGCPVRWLTFASFALRAEAG